MAHQEEDCISTNMNISTGQMEITDNSSIIDMDNIQYGQIQDSVDSSQMRIQFQRELCTHMYMYLNNRNSRAKHKEHEVYLISNKGSMEHPGQERISQYKCPFCSNRIFAAHRLHDQFPMVTCPYCVRSSCSYCKVPSHEGISCFEFSGHGPTNVVIPNRSADDLLLTRGECQTCFEMKATWMRPCCGIRMCLSCLNSYISGKVDEGIIDILCPGHQCLITLDPGLIKQIIDEIKSKRLSFLRVKANRYKFKKACPFCDFILSMDEEVLDYYNNFESIVVCPGCKQEWCVHCMAPWHEGMSCGEYRSSMTNTGVEKWASGKQKEQGDRNAQKCPNCEVRFIVTLMIRL